MTCFCLPTRLLIPWFLFMMRKFTRLLLIACTIVTVSFVGAQQGPQSGKQAGAVQVQMHNVMYHYTDSVSVHLRDLGGVLLPGNAGQIPVFDDRQSFSIQISAAEIAISAQSLASVLNSNVFNGKDAPLKDVEISIEKGRLKVKGSSTSKAISVLKRKAS